MQNSCNLKRTTALIRSRFRPSSLAGSAHPGEFILYETRTGIEPVLTVLQTVPKASIRYLVMIKQFLYTKVWHFINTIAALLSICQDSNLDA
jgi:hypothetical protein